jgi:hypothetical protein
VATPKQFRRRGRWSLVIGTLLAALALASVALATSFDPNGTYTALGGTTLHQTPPISNTSLTPSCTAEELAALPSGGVLWHFVLTNTTTLNTGVLRADFQTAGLTSPDVAYSKIPSGNPQWNIITPTADTLLNASTDSVGDQLNLSHVCYVANASVPADIETAIHLGKFADETPGSPTVVGGATHVDLGSFVHDSATATGGPSTPEGTVDFKFYNTIDCTPVDGGSAAGTVTLDSGVAHPSDDEGALAAGSYSFKAFYTSSDTDVWQNSESLCEPLIVDQAQLDAATKLHDADHNVIADGSELNLGSSVHDTAQITGQVTGFDPTGAVTFTFFNTTDCSDTGTSSANVGADEVSGDPRSDATDALAAGSYGFEATVAGDDNYKGATSACEPFTVKKGDLTITTAIHDSLHNVVTSMPNNSTVHDTATLGGAVSGFDPTPGNVSFTFYTTIDCTGIGTSVANTGADELTGDPRSADVGPLSSGAYSFQASIAADANYNDAGPSSCEPLHVRTFGYTMGFWGNRNGQALLAANNAFGANAVTLGLVPPNALPVNNRCWVKVDSAAKSKTILPNTLNGVSLILQCDTTAERDTGINLGSFNVLLAQNLALGYNNLYKSGFAGQTIGAMGCTAVGTLTSASTTQDAQAYANYLIGNAIKTSATNNSAVISQGQIGAMNTLLGCMNTES